MWCMARVVAVDTAPDGDLAVPVGTGKILPQADFVNPRIEPIFEHPIIRVIALATP